ncbi:hypothetical protein LWI28_004986 [Acer negundo]|uniref:Basic blue protein n=1 Tax=Acer negundo TaxID=4023 RepID=A0AAD5NRJ1_ACENE|nr:hypothetical protein LWI28_004986 [Acer negundo]
MVQQGRGSAMLATVLVSLLVVQLEVAQAATYTVGGAGGWTFNVVGWTKGKQFKAGDVLVFNYNPAIHNVVAVNNAGYKACLTPKGAKVYKTGKDQIKLSKGSNFFICNFSGHYDGFDLGLGNGVGGDAVGFDGDRGRCRHRLGSSLAGDGTISEKA